jgi:hypothetical protein
VVAAERGAPIREEVRAPLRTLTQDERAGLTAAIAALGEL